MARTPGPKGSATDRNPRVHEWKTAPGEGWQHGPTTDKRRKYPPPPPGLTDDGKSAWANWMSSWFASFWTPADIPGLELMVLLYDRSRLGIVDSSKAVALMDRYGVTTKGQLDNRWAKPEPEKPAAPADAQTDELAARREELKARGVG